MVASMPARLATGSAPGSPRQTGHTCVLGSAPNSVGQPQNIFVAVSSSTWTSSPMTGSKAASASSKGMVASGACVVISGLLRGGVERGSAVEDGAAPGRGEPGLERRTHGVEPVVGHRGGEDLEPGGQAVLVGET